MPEQFYGDYLAVLAAVRTGEARLKALCQKHGFPKIKSFLDAFQDYAERVAVAAIGNLPKGRVMKEMLYDSETALYPDGIPIRATIEVDPEAGYVTVDLRDNVDNLPLGINMTESTTLASCMTAVLNILGPDVPRCTGSFKRVKVLMREGAAVGKPRFPAATSAATTNLCHALIPHLQSMFADLKGGLGTAYGSIGMPGSCPVISGSDPRHKGKNFVNQVIMGYWGGPAMHGHDGWLTYGSGGSQGLLLQSSVEVVEQQQPILIEKLEIRPDSGGAGEWEGAPGARCVMKPRFAPVRFMINSASRQHAPHGVRGGLTGANMEIRRVRSNGDMEDLPITTDVVLEPGERLVSEGCGGGGYGSPLIRDPQRVLASVRAGRVSRDRARDVYGVVVTDNQDQFSLDTKATDTLRAERLGESA